MRVLSRPHIVVLVLVLLCGLASNCRQVSAEETTPPFPSTGLGAQCGKWFEAFNSGNYDTMRQMHLSTDPESVAKRRALRDYQVYLMTRGLEAAAIEQASPNTISIAGREKLSRNWVNLIVRGSTKSPFSITEFGLRPGKLPQSEGTEPRPTEIEALMDFDAMLTRLSDADEFSGAARRQGRQGDLQEGLGQSRPCQRCAESNRYKVQSRFGRKDVYRCRGVAIGRSEKTRTRRHGRTTPSGLRKQGCPRAGDDSPSTYAHKRSRRNVQRAATRTSANAFGR